MNIYGDANSPQYIFAQEPKKRTTKALLDVHYQNYKLLREVDCF